MSRVRAPAIAEEFGFTARHWIRLAAAGKIPCAAQPSGPGGHWLFDLDAFREWFGSRGKKEVDRWRPNTRGVKLGGGAPSVKTANSGKASKQEIAQWLTDALQNGSKNSKPSPGATVHPLHSGRR